MRRDRREIASGDLLEEVDSGRRWVVDAVFQVPGVPAHARLRSLDQGGALKTLSAAALLDKARFRPIDRPADIAEPAGAPAAVTLREPA